ncbi:hypothetical protein ACO2Q1_13240 [Brevundimonas sp. VNH65]|uniref:hypothetical protein n=1 Tax=Brevundimonas sp. VNH65 TaxID=3400917 RepID=UPI003C0CC2EC
MSQFDYFVSFYSIVLGLSVVELLTGVARTIEGPRIPLKSTRLTLLLAVFVTLDISSYWLQAWMLYRSAPLSMSVILHGLLAAGSYFLAAYLVFPKPGETRTPDAHFWARRRWVFGLILFTNVLNVGTIVLLGGGLGVMGSAPYIIFVSTFYIACAVAVVTRRRRMVVAALIWLVAFSLLAIGWEAANLAGAGRWTLPGASGPN